MNILFTSAGRRKYLIDYFKAEEDFAINAVGVDMSNSAPALSACDRWHIVPSIYADNYIESLLDICKLEKIDTLISLNDMDLSVLSSNREQFIELGVRLVLSQHNAIDISADKYKTFKFCVENNIPSPISFLKLDDAIESIKSNKVKYPLIAKPRWGSASFEIHKAINSSELEEVYYRCKKNISKSHLSKFKESEDDVIIQEFIDGNEYGVDIFNDMHGNYRGVISKQKISMRAGETDKALTVSNDPFNEFSKIISNSLKHVGNMDCDFLEKDKKLYLLEMNPRFGGGYPFSHEAGGNLVRALLLSMAGRDDEILIDYKVNKMFAKCDNIIHLKS